MGYPMTSDLSHLDFRLGQRSTNSSAQLFAPSNYWLLNSLEQFDLLALHSHMTQEQIPPLFIPQLHFSRFFSLFFIEGGICPLIATSYHEWLWNQQGLFLDSSLILLVLDYASFNHGIALSTCLTGRIDSRCWIIAQSWARIISVMLFLQKKWKVIFWLASVSKLIRWLSGWRCDGARPTSAVWSVLSGSHRVCDESGRT